MNDIFDILPKDLNKELMESLKPSEKEAVVRILNEISSQSGESDLYKDILDADYDEIPVDIDTFIEDDRYIGKVTNNGSTIYPYWRNVLRRIFSPDNNYQEIIFTGAIGLGKTTIAITAMAYILYQLLCLRNPQEFYGLQSNSEIVIAFFNVNLDLSYGVAYKKMQSMLMESPWFLDHGKVYGRKDKNKTYVPDKGIKFRVGSQENHGLGQDIFCLTGDTKVITTDGCHNIEDLYNSNSLFQVLSYNGDNIEESNLCYADKITDNCTELIEITLEDNTKIRCTKDHKFLIGDKYISASDLQMGDNILDLTV